MTWWTETGWEDNRGRGQHHCKGQQTLWRTAVVQEKAASLASGMMVETVMRKITRRAVAKKSVGARRHKQRSEWQTSPNVRRVHINYD